MRKVFNFSAGPAMLPEEVLLQAQSEMLDWHGTGVSIMELSHRGAEFKMVVEETERDLRELMNIPANYHVLFLAGGATAQFSMVPLNLLKENPQADYVNTGIWSKKAMTEAERYGTIQMAATVEEKDGLLQVPPQNHWKLNPKAAYVHYTPNETIAGLEFHWVPETGDVPLVADMTSMILSRPVDVTRFGIIYAAAQKNMGQAGITAVIIREDLVKEPLPYTPALYQYIIELEKQSLYNTAPTYSWYIAGLVLKWLKRQGGVAKISEINIRKAKKLYAVIDAHKEFYINNIHPNSRSIMNVPFDLKTPELTQIFLSEAHQAGLVYLKGHRLGTGIRASIYNAMPEAGVDALASFMQEFVRRYG